MNRPVFRVNAAPTRHGWFVDIPGVGATWAMGPDDIPTAASELVSAVLGCPPEVVDVVITYPSNPAAEESA